MDPTKVIFYASEHGSSKEVAEQISKLLNIESQNFQTIDPAKLQTYNFAIFVVSTYGKGGPPKSCKEAWDKVNAYSENLPNLKFAVFGLGSSSFEDTYLGFAKSIEQKFKALGATEVAKMGEIDECEDSDESYIENWAKSIKF